MDGRWGIPGDIDPPPWVRAGIQLNTWGAGMVGRGDRTPVTPSQQGFGKVWEAGSRVMEWGISCYYPGCLGIAGTYWEAGRVGIPMAPLNKGMCWPIPVAEGTFGHVGDWPWGEHAGPGWCWGWKGGGGGWQESKEGDPLSQGDPGWARARPSPGPSPVTSSHVEPRSRAFAHSREPGTATGAGWDPVSGSEETARGGGGGRESQFAGFFLNTLFL